MTGRTIPCSPRGTELSCRGWPQEAALRMLMNNLDPEVAERPTTSSSTAAPARPRAPGRRSTRSSRAAARLGRRRDAAGAVGQAGRRVPHPRVGAARADRELEPRPGVGDVGRVPPPRGARADDVRPDDRRLVDLHRHARASCRAPTSASPRSPAAASAARSPARSRSPPGSAAWAARSRSAVTMNGGVASASRSTRAHPAPALETRYLDEEAADLDDAVARARRAPSGAGALDRARAATPPTCCPRC